MVPLDTNYTYSELYLCKGGQILLNLQKGRLTSAGHFLHNPMYKLDFNLLNSQSDILKGINSGVFLQMVAYCRTDLYVLCMSSRMDQEIVEMCSQLLTFTTPY